jgi:undecaprenyl-diphosphatase
MLIGLLLTSKRNGATAAAGCASLILWIFAVCTSRVYLGAHYPTDVIGGVLEGIAWLLLMTLAVEQWKVVRAWPLARLKWRNDR